MSRTWAYLSNYLVYSSMAVYTLSFIAHAIETAWAVRVTKPKIQRRTWITSAQRKLRALQLR